MRPDPSVAARELRDAEPGDGFVPLFIERHPDLTWADARAIARARDELRRADGEAHIGYKLGWTSTAMRDALGIDQPNWGTLWDVHRLDGSLDLRRFRHPKIEPELVYVAGERLDGDATVDQVRATAAGWAVGLEVVDPRFVDFGFAWLDNIRDCIAFPKTQRATDLMTGAPGEVEAKQLRELGIRTVLPGRQTT